MTTKTHKILIASLVIAAIVGVVFLILMPTTVGERVKRTTAKVFDYEYIPNQNVTIDSREASMAADSIYKDFRKKYRFHYQTIGLATFADSSRMILLSNDDEIIEMTNEYAPEHLIIQTQNASALAERVVNAGSVFIGPWSPESAGDYASGTNHTLPTSGYAKAYSGVNIDSFMRKITFQQLSREGLKALGPVIETMAAGEYLDAHKNAVTIRIKE